MFIITFLFALAHHFAGLHFLLPVSQLSNEGVRCGHICWGGWDTCSNLGLYYLGQMFLARLLLVNVLQLLGIVLGVYTHSSCHATHMHTSDNTREREQN